MLPETMRPKLKLLSDEVVDKIVDEAVDVLGTRGVEINNEEAVERLAAHGGKVGAGERPRVAIPSDMVSKALETAPSSIKIYDLDGEPALDLSGDNVYFDPGSAAIKFLDMSQGVVRKPATSDYVAFVRIAEGLEHIDAQSTAMIPADVPHPIADGYRLFLSLHNCKKPIVTGAFSGQGFEPMKEMLIAVRGDEQKLASRPLAIFDVCPSSPLIWHRSTSQNLLDCARARIPAQLVSMPLAGAIGPVTIAGSLVQHTAETLSGIVMHQLCQPGAPVIYGGSPAIFDMRCGTTPMGAIDTMMMDCAYVEIGKSLGLPTHAYMGLSDSKVLDAQCGFEGGMGTLLAALAGVNVVSGAGMLDFESCQSIEKLVIDNEICGMAKRMISGIAVREEPIALEILRELTEANSLLAHPHTMRWYREEHYLPSSVVDRSSGMEGPLERLGEAWRRAAARAEAILRESGPEPLPPDVSAELVRIMAGKANEFGVDGLPAGPAELQRSELSTS